MSCCLLPPELGDGPIRYAVMGLAGRAFAVEFTWSTIEIVPVDGGSVGWWLRRRIRKAVDTETAAESRYAHEAHILKRCGV